jgi:hypothetical protein
VAIQRKNVLSFMEIEEEEVKRKDEQRMERKIALK